MSALQSQAAGPLAGVRVLDLTALAPGPFATMLLGDLGADVITVEPPPGRRSIQGLRELPHYGSFRSREAGINPLFRSRRSIAVNLKEPAGLEVVLALAERADVVIEGYRPGVCERLGVGYADVRARNEQIIYCSLTGYGQAGELAQRPGHDINYLAEAGLMSVMTRPGQRPAIPLNVIADFAGGGMVAAFGILAALHGRAQTGTGTYIDVSMYAGVLALLQTATAWTAIGAVDPSWGAGMLSGAAPFYDCYATRDAQWVAIGAVEPTLFANLCTGLGAPELAALQSEPEAWEQLRERLTEIFLTDDRDSWLTRLAGTDTAISPVLSLAEATRLAAERGLVGPNGMPPLPAMTSWPVRARPGARVPGEHSLEILAELGYAGPELDALVSSGAVAVADTSALPAAVGLLDPEASR